MNDTSNLVALYSALIQGGATLLAILGGFLLTVGPARRAGWASALREIQRWKGESERHQADIQRARESYESVDVMIGRNVLRRLKEGLIDPDEASTEIDAWERRVEENFTSLDAATERLTEELPRTLEVVHAQVEATKDFDLVWQLLLVLTVFCVATPAFLLEALHRDSDPFLRGLFAVLVYAGALLYVGIVMSEIGWGRERWVAGDDMNAPKQRWWSDFGRLRRIQLGILIATSLFMLAVGNVPDPRELWDGMRGSGVPAQGTPRAGRPVVVE